VPIGLERVMGIEYIAGMRLLSTNQTVVSKVAACDLRAKNIVIPASASQCDHLGRPPMW
jgi:hypothetical protein